MSDQILYWNQVALDANKTSFSDPTKAEQSGPTLSSRALAIVHLAMHDAYIGASGSTTYAPWLGAQLPAKPVNGNVDAAIAQAAFTALSALYTKQVPTFQAALNTLAFVGGNVIAAQEFGNLVAKEVLAVRAADPTNADPAYVPPTGKYQHKPDPSNMQGYLAPSYGKNSNLIACQTRHALDAPPKGTPEYSQAMKEVRGKGIAPELMGTLPATYQKRTVDESLIGIYWAYDGANNIGTPPRLYNQIVRELSKLKGNTLEQNARLFALVNVAMGDAGILAWEQKYVHNLWRPVVGIREYDGSMRPDGVATNNIHNDCDPMWLPLGAPRSNRQNTINFTPDFPAYPSGHATFGAASLHAARLFYGVPSGDRNNDTLFDNGYFVSEEFNGTTTDNSGTVRPYHKRSFPGGLWQMIEENGRSRVYLGVHWVFDSFQVNALNEAQFDQKIGGVDLGVAIAEDIFDHSMQRGKPVA